MLAEPNVHRRAVVAFGFVAVCIADDRDFLHLAIDVHLHSRSSLRAVVRERDVNPLALWERPHCLDRGNPGDPARIDVPSQPAIYELDKNAIAARAGHFIGEHWSLFHVVWLHPKRYGEASIADEPRNLSHVKAAAIANGRCFPVRTIFEPRLALLCLDALLVGIKAEIVIEPVS